MKLRFTSSRRRRSADTHLKESYRAAMKLDTVGMAVVVLDDRGQMVNSKLLALPWTLGCGLWVAKVEGFGAGGYDCARIHPLVAAGERSRA